MKPIYINRRVGADFDILDKLEVGLVLYGWEVKSIKAGRVEMGAAYIEYTDKGELVLKQANVASWTSGFNQPDELKQRARKLLANKSEAAKIGNLAKRPGFTLVPTRIYTTDRGIVKMEIAVVKGRKKFQKRQKMKERDMKREAEQQLKYMR